MKLHILKITDRDEQYDNPMYYTIKGLRNQILNEWYDVWGDLHKPHEQDYTKEQIQTSDEDMFSWLNGWGYDVEFILTITENDIPKKTNVIEVDISYYHPDDDETKKVYDIEGMTEEFENKLTKLL